MTKQQQAILVTGATGFLGRRLCQRLKSEGERVIALGRRPSDGPWDTFLQIDLSFEAVPAEALAGVSTVYHLASKAHAVAETEADTDSYRPVIVEGTQRLLDASRKAGIRRFIFMSTVKVMGEGNPAHLPLSAMTEDWPHTPQSPYGVAKVEAEKRVRESGLEHVVILRPAMVFGPGEKGNLPRMVEAVKRGRFPPIPETENQRSMIHVDDVIEFALLAGVRPLAAGRTYILAGTQATSTRQLYDAIRKSLGMPPRSWSIPGWLLSGAATIGSMAGFLTGRRMPLDRETLGKLTGSAWYSSAKAYKELGYQPRYEVLDWLVNGD